LQIEREGDDASRKGVVLEGTRLEEYVEKWVWLFGFRRQK
jgi:hypothetical protein